MKQQKKLRVLAATEPMEYEEYVVWYLNGFYAAFGAAFLALGTFLLFFYFLLSPLTGLAASPPFFLFLLPPLLGFGLKGFFILKPGDAAVFTFFGQYAGSCKEEGFHFANPLSSRQKLSIKANNLATATLKVNDANGNPIEIAASIVWMVSDTAKALFQIEEYSEYARIQAESALRQLASTHPYDSNLANNTTPADNAVVSSITSLRSDTQQVTEELIHALKTVMNEAGLGILDARITHLAYAPEIAQSMLRRQQAQQIVAAREQIVMGAVKLTEDVILKLQETKLVTLSTEDRAKLVINLLTVLVSESEAQPVLPMGTN